MAPSSSVATPPPSNLNLQFPKPKFGASELRMVRIMGISAAEEGELRLALDAPGGVYEVGHTLKECIYGVVVLVTLLREGQEKDKFTRTGQSFALKIFRKGE